MSPEQCYKKIRSCIKKEWIICFLAALIAGLIAHFYKLTNHIPNWDSLQNFYSTQNTITLGRCFLTIACGLTSYYDLYWLNGFISLIYISITSVIVSEIFEVKKPFSLIACGAVLAVFPTVTATLTYMYTADGYFLGMLCMSLAILLTIRRKRGWIPGCLLICFGFGIYQAYITFAMVLVLFFTIDKLLFSKLSIKELFAYWGRFLLCAGLGALLYFICNKLLLSLQNKMLADYQGIKDAASGSSINPLLSIRQCLIDFAYFMIGPLDQINIYSVLNILLLLCIMICLIALIIKKRLYLQPARLLLLLFCFAMLPFCAFALYFISSGLSYHMLMLMSLSLLYLYFAFFYEKLDIGTPKIQSLIKWTTCILTFFIVYNFILIANISYQTLELSFQKSYGLIQRISSRMEETQGASECKKLAVIGRLPDSDAVSFNLPPDMTGITDGYIMSSPLHFQSMLTHYAGLSYELVPEDTLEAFLDDPTYQNMPSWPNEGCILVKSDIIVIKIGNIIPKTQEQKCASHTLALLTPDSTAFVPRAQLRINFLL